MENLSEFCIITGKNSRLSLAEIIALLSGRNIEFRIKDFGKQFIIVDCVGIDGGKFVNSLGGSLKLCKIVKESSRKLVEKEVSQRDPVWVFSEYFNEIKDNLGGVFGISVYVEDLKSADFSRVLYHKLGNCIKTKAAGLGSKNIKFMGFPEKRSLPQLTNVEVIKKGLVENSVECVIVIGKERIYFCTTQHLHNPFEFQKRDVKRPFQRPVLGISPRLARIMVNLSCVQQGQKLLDPFCGYGTILQEALLLGANVTGTDINSDCVSSAKQNLSWISKEYRKYNLGLFDVVLQDATKLEKKFAPASFDAIVTEPLLGPVLSKKPSEKEAEKILNGLEKMYIKFLNSARHVLRKNGRLVMTTPVIVAKNGRASINMAGLVNKAAGFKVVNPLAGFGGELEKMKYILDYDHKDIIRRKITIFKS